MSRRIAIVEDEPAILENYRDFFSRQGYDVEAFSDRESAWAALQNRLPDLAILDIGLKDDMEGGFDLCRVLRALSPSLPIIFLTARDNEFDTISGLRLGADDYLTKDISLPHLAARIAALFRRISALKEKTPEQNQLTHDELSIDLPKLIVTWSNKPIDLTLTEFWIIHSLARKPGHVKSRDQLMQEANICVDDGTITSHIKRIRRKFQEVDSEFDCIDTVYGMGYRWKGKFES